MEDENEILEELMAHADHYLAETGSLLDKRPSVFSSEMSASDSRVDYVPRTDTVVYRGVEKGDLHEIEEDTVKLLARVYNGLKTDFNFDSRSYNTFERVLEDLPDNWVLPFRDTSTLSEVQETRLGSELWKRRQNRLIPVIDRLIDQVRDYKEEYDEVAEPLLELESWIEPENPEELSYVEISDYYDSSVKDQFIEEVKAGKRRAFERFVEKKRDLIYESASKSKEEVDEKLEEVDGALDEINEVVNKLDRAEYHFVNALNWEIKDMTEDNEPSPQENAVAYMLEPLVNGSLADPEMEPEIWNQYIMTIEEEEGPETADVARALYRNFQNYNLDGVGIKESFKRAVNEIEGYKE